MENKPRKKWRERSETTITAGFIICFICATANPDAPYFVETERPRYEKPYRKCRREACNVMHNGNNLWCSPECCKIDKEVKG